MSIRLDEFDLASVDPAPQFEALPPGNYVAQATEIDLIETKSGTGQMFKVTFEVMQGEHASRKIFCRLNVRNENAQAEKIGRQQLVQLINAAGLSVSQVSANAELLLGKPVSVRVTLRKSDQYGDQNDVKGFSAIEGVQPSAPAKKPWA